jgi:type III pantothenate kinase
MLLAVDVGNTHTVFGVYAGPDLRGRWRVATTPVATEDELWVVLRGLLEEERIAPAELEAIIIASVVPSLSDALTGLCDRYLDREPIFVSSEIDLGLDVKVQPPTAAGADRLANAVAAAHKYGVPAIVVDMGTATTFDVLNADGAYIGGIIAPGVHAAAENLFSRAARLAKVDIRPPAGIIGDSTEESLHSGLYLGTLAMIDGLLAGISGELGREPAVIFTGGLSAPFEAAFAERGAVDQDLTLDGLRLIHSRLAGG